MMKKDIYQTLWVYVLSTVILAMVFLMNYLLKTDKSAEIVSPSRYRLTNYGSLPGTIFVAPSEPGVWSVMNSTVEIIASNNYKSSNIQTIQYFQSEEAMLNAYLANQSGVETGIVFKYNGGQLADYAIRVPYSEAPDTTSWITEKTQCRSSYDTSNCDVNKYLSNGFTVLQAAINTALIKSELNGLNFKTPTVRVQMMPKLVSTSYKLPEMMSNFLSLFFVCIALPLSGQLLSMVKKKKKETMKMMGLKTYAYWLSWLIMYCVNLTVWSAVITVITVTFNILTNSYAFIFFVIMLLYGLSIATLSLAMATRCYNLDLALLPAVALSLLFGCLYAGVNYTMTVSGVVWCCISFIPPFALAKAIEQALLLEHRFKHGMQFSSMTVADVPLWLSMLLMLLDIIVYFFLAIYLENILKGGFGVKNKSWCCFTKSFWVKKPKQDGAGLFHEYEFSDVWEENVEPVNADFRRCKMAVKVTNICKQFKSNSEIVNAVNGFSLEIYKGQITCLLGHNGAGKTTLIKMLTGMISPSSGGAHILGLDICNNEHMNIIRSKTGACQQHDVLYRRLTVSENLMLFGSIKGVPSEDLKEMCENGIKNVNLFKEKDTPAYMLSGGQRRKLSVAIALIGDPEVIFLDEPTAGLDPFSRRQLWSVLKQNKQNRAIIVTTHFMEEADSFSDRKVIMSKGKLRCCGSSLYLKTKFGIGYHLNIMIDPSCNPERVTEHVQGHVQGAELRSIIANGLVYTLPLNHVIHFAGLFDSLEKCTGAATTMAESLGIKTYGLSHTSLEEVFLKLEEDDSTLYDTEFIEDARHNLLEERTGNTLEHLTQHFETPQQLQFTEDENKLWSMHFWTLLKMWCIRLLRYKVFVILLLGISITFVIGGHLAKLYKPSAPVPLNMTVAAEHYARRTGGESRTNTLLIKDSVGTAESTVLMNFLKSAFATDTYTAANISLLSMSSEHYLGVDLQQYVISGSTNNWTLLRVSGITRKMYVTTNLFVYLLLCYIPFVMLIFLTLASEVNDLRSTGAVLSMLMLFITTIPSSVLHFCFCGTKEPAGEGKRSVLWVYPLFFPLMITAMLHAALMLVDLSLGGDTATVFHCVFCVLYGPYQMTGGLYYIHKVQERHNYMTGPESEEFSFGDYFSAPICVTFVMAFLHTVFWAFQLRILDIRSIVGDKAGGLPCFLKNKTKNPNENTDDIEDEDNDVVAERQRVQNLLPSYQNTSIVVENVRKEFKQLVAVRNATFAVDTGEIFGFLGPNGAGKTTILKMITTELIPTNGKVTISGYDTTRSSMSDSIKGLGYCPQQNALWNKITLEEHLEFYAAIRGIPKKNIKPVVDFFMKRLKIDEHAKKYVSSLSGGTKRKLSYIIAMLGKRNVVLLDEPSLGMDPKSKRCLWESIRRDIIGSNKGIILTSHSMEEADALCSRVAIMVKGKIECIGATQHLKEKFGSGYLLEVKMSLSERDSEDEIEKDMKILDNHLKFFFPDFCALERFGERAKYEIPKDNVKSLGQTFKALEDAKRIFGLEEYSFCQPTLEQVFMKFAKK